MSQIYVPGLKREENCIVRKTRRLPIKGEVLVVEGEEVTFDQKIAEAVVKGPEVVVDAYEELHVLSAIFDNYTFKKDFLLKDVGEKLTQGEVIAKRKAWGLLRANCLSPINGTIEKIEIPDERHPLSCLVHVRLPSHTIDVEAFIPGRVHRVLENEGAIIEVNAAYIQGIFGVGRETRGELAVLPSQSRGIQSIGITEEHKGKVVVIKKDVSLEVLKKAVDVGVSALIVGSIADKTLENFIGGKPDVVSGGEDYGLTLIVTEGFGQISMLEKNHNLLKKYEGKIAFVNGATQMRAGVIRPEVIIPHSQKLDSTSEGAMETVGEVFSEGVNLGDKIRVIREPNFGKIGYVTNLPEASIILKSEVEAMVLEIETEEGEKIVVPRSNTEIID